MRLTLLAGVAIGIAYSAAPGAQSTAALRAESVAPPELRDLLIPSPYRMSRQARMGTIRYRLRFDEGAAWFWPETGEQRVRSERGIDVLTICRDCGREGAPTTAELDFYRRPNAWVQSDDAVLIGFSRRAKAGSVATRMDRLVIAVRERLSGPIDYVRYMDAREAYDARSGDCTEFALLLAALARARGIPTRVVAGVAYGSRFLGTPHAFGPHMWVQAWTGQRWESFDAGLDDFDAGHLALAIGDGSPESLRGSMDALRRLRIVDAEGVLPRAEGEAAPR